MSSTKGRRRYSLVVKNILTGQKYSIQFKERDEDAGKVEYHDKAFLTTIDQRTTDFADDQQLIEYLNEKGYIDFDGAEVYITYNEGKAIKTLDVIYSDQTELKKLATDYTTYVDTNNVEFKKIFRVFVEDMQKGRFYRFMNENNFINLHLKSLLEEYIYENKLYRETDILKEMSRYKVIRGYILGKQRYEELMNIPSINQHNNEVEDDTQIPTLHIDSDDDFLNSLKDLDDVFTYYDLDDLVNKEIFGDKPLFDGLTKTDKVKRMER